MRLLESGKARSRSFLQTVASGVLHAGVIAAAGYATAGAAEGIDPGIRDTAIVFLPPPPLRSVTTTPPAVAAIADAPPMGFQVVPPEAIKAGRFKPARIAGHAVRQLVQQTIRFTIR